MLLTLASFNKDFVESVYSKELFPKIASILSSISDSFTFSISELILVTVFVIFISFILKIIYNIFHKNKNAFNTFKNLLSITFIFLSCLFISFYLSWGINYYRAPLKEQIKSNLVDLNESDFKSTLLILLKASNKLADSVKDEYPFDKVNNAVEKGLSHYFSKSIHHNTAKKRKHFYMNIMLEKMLVSGITIPFFNEIHLDKKLLNEEVPFVLAHEKAHLHGITGEGEANFIAFLACMKSENLFCQYSAYTTALRYFLFKLYRSDKKEYKKLFEKVHPKTKELYKKIRERIIKNRGIWSDLQSRVNNAYLKANGVKKGTKDYGELVRYLMYYYKNDEHIDLKY